MRTANSRRRDSTRARERFARFAQPMRRTSPTPACSSQIARLARTRVLTRRLAQELLRRRRRVARPGGRNGKARARIVRSGDRDSSLFIDEHEHEHRADAPQVPTLGRTFITIHRGRGRNRNVDSHDAPGVRLDGRVRSRVDFGTDARIRPGQRTGVIRRHQQSRGGRAPGRTAVNDQRFQVRQEAAACRFAIAPQSRTLSAAGGEWEVTVSATIGCAWRATSNVSWVDVKAGEAGIRDGVVRVQADSNSNPNPRTGSLTIAGENFAVAQSGTAPDSTPAPPPPICAYTLSPASTAAPAAGGTGSTALEANHPGCVWTVTSDAPWLTATIDGAPAAGRLALSWPPIAARRGRAG